MLIAPPRPRSGAILYGAGLLNRVCVADVFAYAIVGMQGSVAWQYAIVDPFDNVGADCAMVLGQIVASDFGQIAVGFLEVARDCVAVDGYKVDCAHGLGSPDGAADAAHNDVGGAACEVNIAVFDAAKVKQ